MASISTIVPGTASAETSIRVEAGLELPKYFCRTGLMVPSVRAT